MKIGQSPEGITRFYLAHDISALPVGTRFIKNPPHVTQTPPALVEQSRMPEVEEYLENVAAQTDAIALKSMGLMLVGHRAEPTLATRFENNETLAELHQSLINGLGKLGCEFVSLQWALNGYTPHSEGLLIDPGATLLMDNITMFTKRRNPVVNGLSEVTSRYDLRRSM